VRLLLPVGRSAWAVAAGYFGLLSLIPIFSIPALVCGFMAIAHIKKSQLGPSPKHGMGRAIFGIVMGVLGLIWGIVILWGIYS
jgi:predicted acyltransferase